MLLKVLDQYCSYERFMHTHRQTWKELVITSLHSWHKKIKKKNCFFFFFFSTVAEWSSTAPKSNLNLFIILLFSVNAERSRWGLHSWYGNGRFATNSRYTSEEKEGGGGMNPNSIICRPHPCFCIHFYLPAQGPQIVLDTSISPTAHCSLLWTLC